MTTTVLIPMSIDATVAQDISGNRGSAQFLSVYTGTADDTRRIFASGVRSFPLGARIVSAKLRATQQAVAESASRTLRVRPVIESWKESTISWANQPDDLASVEAEVTLTGAGSVGRVAEWDVTAMSQRVADGAPFYGFRIHSTSTSLIRFFSQESGRGLVWEVEYSTAPAPPSRLAPSAGRAVSIVRPTLAAGSTLGTETAMTGFRVQLFSGGESLLSTPSVMNERIGSFNVNGVNHETFTSRLNGLGAAILGSGAAALGLQECSDNIIDQPAQLLAKVKELSSNPDWLLFNGPNLNCLLIDGDVFEPQWPTTSDKGLGDGKWATAMLVKHKVTGATFILWTTHYLTSGFLAEQVAHTKVLITWLASLAARYGVPLVGTGDFNAKSRLATAPMGMFALAGHVDARDLVEPEDIVNRTFNSLDGYGANPMQGYWIDHVLISGGPAPTLVGLFDTGAASDHNIVYADVEYVAARPAVAGLGEPTFDTGERDGTEPRWEIERDVEVDEVIGHRWQVRYGTDWSDWSDVAFFTRKLKPTLTIVNPGEPPDDYVTESTPPFIAESTGTQTAYRILVTDPIDKTVVLWDSGRQGKPDMTVTPTVPLGLVSGQRYRVEWQSEDDVAREATPGDPIPVIAEREFSFELSSEVAPPTLLTVTQPDERPWARVEFRSSTAPDAIEILRDGISLGIFAPGDLFVSGGVYAYIDRRVAPQTEHVWEVRRIVNGVTSEGRTDTFTTNVTGTWICSEDGQYAIVLGAEGGKTVQWSPDEDVEIQRPLGGSVGKPVTHGIFGRQGSLQGSVLPWGDQTVASARATLAALRPPVAPYGTPMVLTQVDEAVRIFWVGVVDDHRHEFGQWFDIAAELHEVPDGVA